MAGAEDLSNIRALEEEIMELQEYNAQVESEMYQLQTDITQMELPQRLSERVSKGNEPQVGRTMAAVLQNCENLI